MNVIKYKTKEKHQASQYLNDVIKYLSSEVGNYRVRSKSNWRYAARGDYTKIIKLHGKSDGFLMNGQGYSSKQYRVWSFTAYDTHSSNNYIVDMDYCVFIEVEDADHAVMLRLMQS